MSNQMFADNAEESKEYLSFQNTIDKEKQARQQLTNKWIDLWSLYKTKPIKVRDNTGWQSKLNDGRVFELIETVGAYIRNAVFYSDRWLSVESNDPDLGEIMPLVSAMVSDKLNLSNFKKEFRLFLTQLLLTGFSSMLPYWDTDNDCLSFQCLNSYDVFIESSQRYSERFSYSFRQVYLNEAEFTCWVNDGLIDVDDAEGAWDKYAKAQEDRASNQYRLKDTQELSDLRTVLVYEYYEPQEKELYRMIDDEILFCETVDRCPWLICTLFDTPEDAYALSLVDSSIGLVLANNLLHNRRLDNIALSIDNMWLFVDDGITNPDDIVTAPGKVITVQRTDTLTPLRPPANNFEVTYGEGQVLDAKIDKNIGVGAGISANTYRTGERVTAKEIESVKDAGGSRLTDVYEHIEHECLLPLLRRAYLLLSENITKAEQVKLASSRPGAWDFFKVLPKDLDKNHTLRVSGTQTIINRDRNISLITDFLTLVAGVPQFQPLIDYKNLYFDMLVKFGFDDPSRYMLEQKPEAEAPATPQSPLQQMATTAQDVGGQPMVDALQQGIATGQAVPMANDLQGISPQTTQQMDEQQNAQALAVLSTPQP